MAKYNPRGIYIEMYRKFYDIPSQSMYIYIYIMFMKERESTVLKIKIEVQVYAPRLEPAAPIRLAHRNHTHYPSRRRTILKKDGSMTDFKHTHSDPHGSHRKMLHVLLTHLLRRRVLTFFPAPQRATSQTVESSSLQGAQTRCIQIGGRRESE